MRAKSTSPMYHSYRGAAESSQVNAVPEALSLFRFALYLDLYITLADSQSRLRSDVARSDPEQQIELASITFFPFGTFSALLFAPVSIANSFVTLTKRSASTPEFYRGTPSARTKQVKLSDPLPQQ